MITTKSKINLIHFFVNIDDQLLENLNKVPNLDLEIPTIEMPNMFV